MAVRLEIAHGLVSDSGRLSTSSDTLGVTEPSTGSKTRTKGVLHLVVSSSVQGPRAREATARVAETIAREYYYDESAGVPVCLEKAVKSADRRLRGSREGAGLPPGALGIGVAVIRDTELYLATIGGVEAYLVRSARLLMPDRQAATGLPADEGMRLDVWRGELAVGDALVLVSRNLTETVGTDEIRNAVLTLHPQSAVEHLHHLFVAAGGEGSDAVIAVEARELATRSERRSATPAATDAYGDLPPSVPGPTTAAATAVGGVVGGARAAVTRSVDRVLDAMPRRTASATRISPQADRAETQRRVAIALLAFLGVVVTLGVLVWLLPRGAEREVLSVGSAEAAFVAARDAADEADGLVESDRERALSVYRDALREVRRARALGLSTTTTSELDERIRDGLDSLYAARTGTTRMLTSFEPGADPGGIVRGPDRAAYVFDRTSGAIARVEPDDGATVQVGVAGEGAWEDVDAIHLLAAGGPDVIIVDSLGEAWRWRPSNRRGRGTLVPMRIGGDLRWTDEITDVDTFLLPGQRTGGLYNMYVVDPPTSQIQRYNPTADGNGFSAPTRYLITDNPNVGTYRDLLIDGDIYAVTGPEVLKHNGGRQLPEYQIETPPDDVDLRPGHDYRAIDGSAGRGSGKMYLYDATWGRIVVFDKSDGDYLAQWSTGPDGPSMKDVRGMYVVEGTRARDPATVVWVSPEGVFETRLATPPAAEPGS